MKKALLFLLLVFGVGQSFAQNYAPLQLGVKRYFINDSGYLRGIRVDSVVQEVGYVRYKTFGTVRQYLQQSPGSSLYVDTIGASWIGQDMREYPNGDWHFPVGDGDTILLKPQAALLDEWTFYNDASAVWFKAKVSTIDTETVFGILDSVKTITLNSMQGSVVLVSHPLNGWTIRISKNNGFVVLPDFYLFPDYTIFSGTPSFWDCWYKWLSDASGWNTYVNSFVFRQTVPVFPNERVINDLQPGDVFGRSHYTTNSMGTEYYIRTLDSVLQRVDSPTKTIYTIKTWKWYTDQYFRNPYNITQVTQVFEAKDTLLVDTSFMPEEILYIPAGGGPFGYYPLPIIQYFKQQDNVQCVQAPSWKMKIGHTPPCYPGEGGPTSVHYVVGLGLCGSQSISPQAPPSWSRLDYARKNGISCGTPWQIPTAVKDIDFAATVTLYPQPANESFRLKGKLQFPVTAMLLNLQQQALSSQNISDATQPVTTAPLPNGLYFLSVKDAAGNAGVLKVLVQH